MANEKLAAAAIVEQLGQYFDPQIFYGYIFNSFNCLDKGFNSTLAMLYANLHKYRTTHFNPKLTHVDVLLSVSRALDCLNWFLRRDPEHRIAIDYHENVRTLFEQSSSSYHIQVRGLIEQSSSLFSDGVARELKYRNLLNTAGDYSLALLDDVLDSARIFAKPTTPQVELSVNSILKSLREIKTDVRILHDNGLTAPHTNLENQTKNFTQLLSGYQTLIKKLHIRATQLPFYAYAFVMDANDVDSTWTDNRNERASYGCQTHYRVHTEFCHLLDTIQNALSLMEKLDQSQIEADDARLDFDRCRGYEKFPEYDQGWSKCQLDTATLQYGKGARPGQFGPPECDTNPSPPTYNFYNRKQREPNGFRHRDAFGSELTPLKPDACSQALTVLEPDLTLNGRFKTGVKLGAIFAIPTAIREGLIFAKVLTKNQAEMLQLGVNVALAAVNPDSWGPLFVSIVVNKLMMKIGVNRTISKWVASLVGFGYALYKEDVITTSNFARVLMQHQASYWTYEFLDWGAESIRYVAERVRIRVFDQNEGRAPEKTQPTAVVHQRSI